MHDARMLLRDRTTPERFRHAAARLIGVDPMPVTGGSAVAFDLLEEASARSIRRLCLVAAPGGLRRLERRHPEVAIYAPAVDRALNAQPFIVPGLGDFGDRLYGTC